MANRPEQNSSSVQTFLAQVAAIRGALAVAVSFILMGILGALVLLLGTLGFWTLGWRVARFWSRTFLFLLGIDVRLHGEMPQSKEGFIVAPNHTSSIDILVFMSFIPNMIAVGKYELKKIPIFGWAYQSLGNILVKRGGGVESSKEMISEVQRRAANRSVLIFPEGARSVSGKLMPVKKGFVHLALTVRKPIIPIYAIGGHELHPKGQHIPRSGTYHLYIGKPCPTQDWTIESLEDHRILIQEQLEALRKSTGAP